MKIAFITPFDTSDIHSWSGTVYHTAKSIERQGVTLQYIDKIKVKNNFLLKIIAKLLRLAGRRIFINSLPYYTKTISNQIKNKIDPDVDLIFAIPTTTVIAHLETNLPIVLYADATFFDFASKYFGPAMNTLPVCKTTMQHVVLLEKHALNNCKKIIYSSQWAANSAIDRYNIDPEKISVIPFGANMTSSIIQFRPEKIITERSRVKVELLFIGVNWIRKGGEFALRVTEDLNSKGINTVLHIVGIKHLPKNNLRRMIVNHGYINKRNTEGLKKLEDLFARCLFFILPTKADCTPIVFSEANSFALPCLATEVGGIPSIIKNDVNGKLFSLNSSIDEWSDYIFCLTQDILRYNDLCMSSYGEYKKRLNWDSTGKSLVDTFNSILDN